MGRLTLPASGFVYIDAQIAIYTVDKHQKYAPICQPLWDAVMKGEITAVSSELILVETLVIPLRNGDRKLINDREAL